MWLVGGDGASVLILEDGRLAVAAGVDVVVVQELVVTRAEQDEVVENGRAAALDRDDVVCFEFAGDATAGVLAVRGAVAQRPMLRVGGAAADA